jgi:hypothetical protein
VPETARAMAFPLWASQARTPGARCCRPRRNRGRVHSFTLSPFIVSRFV